MKLSSLLWLFLFIFNSALVALKFTQPIDEAVTSFKCCVPFFEKLTVLGNTEAIFAVALLASVKAGKKLRKKLGVGTVFLAVLVRILKELFSRPRPNGIDLLSYPSGHATLGFYLYYTLFRSTKKWYRWVFLAIALLIPISRLILGVHWLSDVLGGVFLAMFVYSLIS